jgi:hypothetical protein
MHRPTLCIGHLIGHINRLFPLLTARLVAEHHAQIAMCSCDILKAQISLKDAQTKAR